MLNYFFNLVYINIIITDLSVLNIIKTIQQIGNSGLAGSSRSYKGDLLTGLGKEGNVMEDDNIFMCEYMTGLPTLAKVKKGDTQLDIEVEKLLGLYE